MNQKFVYLILSQKRLVILSSKMNDRDYRELMNTGNDGGIGMESLLMTTCKMFCIGYIMGSQSSIKPVNLLEEFQ
jgi:hypothetical protein